jgi:hypothetical protein
VRGRSSPAGRAIARAAAFAHRAAAFAHRHAAFAHRHVHHRPSRVPRRSRSLRRDRSAAHSPAARRRSVASSGIPSK